MTSQDPHADLPIGAPVPDPTPRSRPTATALQGDAVSLRPHDPSRDSEALFAASHGTPELERVWTYLPAGPFSSAAELEDWYRTMAEPGDPHFYTVIDNRNEAPSGIVSFLAIEPDHGSIEIGHIWYTPSLQRTAANTEACYLLLREAFDSLGYRRMEWKCDALNARSRAAALRLGFQFEGVFRQHRIVNGRNRDTAWFSILDSEWPTVRAGMERWLGWKEEDGSRPSLSTLRDAAGSGGA